MGDDQTNTRDKLNFSTSLFGMEYRTKRTHREMIEQSLNNSNIDNLTEDLKDKLNIQKKKIESKTRKKFNFEEEEELKNKKLLKKEKLDTKENKFSVLSKKNDKKEKNDKEKYIDNKIIKEIENSESEIKSLKKQEIEKLKNDLNQEISQIERKSLDEKNEEESQIITSNKEKKKKNINNNLFKKTLNDVEKRKSESLMKEEYDRISKLIKDLNDDFINNKIPILINKITKYCNIKSKTKKPLKMPKINNYFSEVSFQITRQYNNETSPINIFVSFFDLLFEKNDFYDIIIKSDMENIGNLLLYYFSQINIITYGQKLLYLMKHYIDSSISQNKIILKNENNTINYSLNLIMNKFFETLKIHKEFLKNNNKNLKIENKKENSIRTHSINIMKTRRYPQLMSLLSLDFDKNENNISDIIQKNPSYLNFQLKDNNNKLYFKSEKNNLDIKFQCMKKRKEIYLKKQKADNIRFKINNIVGTLNIFSLKNEDLMSDFLSE